MANVKKTNNPDLNRRDALKRLGLAVGVAYMTPTLLSLSNAYASSGGGSGSGGSGSSGGGTSTASSSTASTSTASTSTASASAASASASGSVDETATDTSTICLLGIIGAGC